jgi:hypothetical protein
MLDGTVRVKTVAWSATTAVLAVLCTLLVTQAWSVDAAPGDTDSTFVPTAGCRLVDTRPGADNVGPRSTPIGQGGIFEVTAHGSNGRCTGGLAIPSDAVAIALNATSVNPTATSNIRLYPANLSSVPLLSNLNVTAGGPATPNKVDVKLSPDGKLRVFNQVGSVDIILDVIGYYTGSSLQELSQRVAALESGGGSGGTGTVSPALLQRVTTLENAQPFAVTNRDDTITLDSNEPTVVSVSVTAPVAGQVTVNSTTTILEDDAGVVVVCVIRRNGDAGSDADYTQVWQAPGFSEVVDPSAGFAQMSGTRVFNIAAGATGTYDFVCDTNPGDSPVLNDSVLTAIFTPAR